MIDAVDVPTVMSKFSGAPAFASQPIATLKFEVAPAAIGSVGAPLTPLSPSSTSVQVFVAELAAKEIVAGSIAAVPPFFSVTSKTLADCPGR